MKKNLLFGLMFSLAGSLMAADSSPKDSVTSAATALGNEANYSWHTTVENAGGGGGGRGAGPSDGKTEKDGYTWVSTSRGGNTTVAVLKGTNGAINSPDNGWQSLKELTADNGGGFNPAMFLAMQFQNYKTPDQQAVALANAAADLKAGDNGITGDLTADGAKGLLAFGRPPGGGGDAPTVANPKGSVTFWLTDGKLVKYQFHVTGTVSFGGNDRDIDRTTTVEIKDVGATKLDVPDDAKKKLE
jgi:hypothetical protein